MWAQRGPERPEQVFSQAYRLYADQFYDQALVAFEDFRAAYPNHISAAEALYYQAESALALERSNQAVALFRSFQQQYPAHPLAFQARLALGQYFFQAEDYERALETLRQVLWDEPPDEVAAKAWYWMGESALNLGRTDAALGYYRRVVQEYRFTDTAPIAQYAVAYTYVQQQRYDEAAQAFESLAATYPASPYSRTIGLALAEIYYELGDYKRVAAEIQRRMPALRGEAREQALFLLAEAYNQLRDSENAIINYRYFTEQGPSSPYYRRALYGLAWNYYQEGVYEWAADNFAAAREGFTDELAMKAAYYQAVNLALGSREEEAVRHFAAVADAWPNGEMAGRALYEKGIVHYKRLEWEDAFEAFDRLLKAYPQSEQLGEALRQRGYTAIALNRYDQAFRDFDRALALDAVPQALVDEIIFQRAWLRYRTGDFEAAAPAFLELYEQDPGADKAGESLFWAAESFFQIDQLDRAQGLFREYLREFPSGSNTEAAHYALGWVHFKQGQYEAAIGEFRGFLSAYRGEDQAVPYQTDAQLRLADSYYALKRYPEAIRLYQQVAERGEGYALFQVGQAFNNAGDAFEAITAFRELLLRHQDSDWVEEAQYALGYLYFQNQDYQEAIRLYQELLVKYPGDPLAARAQYGIGDALYNDGQLEASVAAYMRVLERYPNSPYVSDAASGVQYALLALEAGGEAETSLDDFIADNPNSPVIDELRFRRAEVLFQSGRYARALAELDAFVRASNDPVLLADAYFYQGSIYEQQGQYGAAEQAWSRVVDGSRQSTRWPEAALRLGRLYLDEGRPNEALPIFQQLERARPGDARLVAEAQYGQGQALLALGRAQEAERLMRSSLDANPDAPEAVLAALGLGKVHEQAGRAEEALRLYRQVVERSRDEAGAEALYRLGALLLEQGDSRSAVEELSRMPVLYAGYAAWLAQGYLVQARAFRSLGQNGEAARLYDLIIASYADTPYAEAASREKASL